MRILITDCPRDGKVETMKITKEMVAKHIMNQDQINKNFMRICQELADDYNAEYED